MSNASISNFGFSRKLASHSGPGSGINVALQHRRAIRIWPLGDEHLNRIVRQINVDGFRNVFRQKRGGGSMLRQASNPDDFLEGWEVQVSKRTEDR